MRCAIQRSVLATLISVAVAAPAWADSGEMLATARAVLAEAIELGDNDAIAKAQIAIGNIHYRGLGVSRDIGEAVKWYLEAAEAGDAEAQYYVGSISYVGDYSAPGPSWDVDSPHSFRGLGWIQSAAEQGYVGAQLMLGQIFSEGARGVPTDSAEAVKWYRGAADQGNAEAQFNLGIMYGKGRGVAQDHAEAMRWYRKAADQGDAIIRIRLGNRYFNGEDGVPQDLVQAHMWLSVAMLQKDTVPRAKGADWDEAELTRKVADGTATQQEIHSAFGAAADAALFATAESTINLMMSLMTPEEIEESEHLAREWLESSGR